MVGYGGDEEIIRKLIEENNFQESFILLGKKFNPYPYMKKCDLYVQPSRYEGKAVTVGEAQILGKPVMITNYTTAKSQVKEDFDGYICDSTIEGAIKKLYKTKEERSAALTRHLEFFNTHPYVASPIIGVTLALEEDRANGAQVDDVTIQGVKVVMMGPLAGIGDPVFWFTVRPILGALGASLAMAGNHIRTNNILLRLEYYPYGIYLVHTRIWL